MKRVKTYNRIYDFVILNEDWRNKPYKCTAQKNTIGVGHNMDAQPLPQHIQAYLDEKGEITDEMVLELLESDIQFALHCCRELYPNFDQFDENRRIALIDFLFNVGPGTAKTFIRTNKAINNGEWQMAASNMRHSLWYSQVKSRGVRVTQMIEKGGRDDWNTLG